MRDPKNEVLNHIECSFTVAGRPLKNLERDYAAPPISTRVLSLVVKRETLSGRLRVVARVGCRELASTSVEV